MCFQRQQLLICWEQHETFKKSVALSQVGETTEEYDSPNSSLLQMRSVSYI